MNNRNSHLFSKIPATPIQRSVFDRSHEYKSTFDASYLVPFYCDEILPGDSFKIDVTTFARLNTPIVPIMDNLYMDTFFFFVPTRLLWKHFQNFMGEQKNPGDSIDYVVPTFKDGTTFSELSLGDYFGLPTKVALNDVNCLPFRAYNLIYNEWFRDENLIDSVYFDDGDGKDDISNYTLLKRGKRHDYFTSCLPWPQKGDSVDLPLNDTSQLLPLRFDDDKYLYARGFAFDPTFSTGQGSDTFSNWQKKITGLAYGPKPSSEGSVSNNISNMFQIEDLYNSASSNPFNGVMSSNTADPLFAELTALGSVTINSLRQAFQLQKFLERSARSGTRYTEILRGHFGVISPDARLQRPEYIGGRSTRININPVVQTSSTDSTSPQGNLSAFGVVGSNTHVMSKSFTEHGYIIGLVNVRADLTYQQGINRMWSRRTRYDYYWPSFAHLGEQSVLNKEIYAQGSEDDEAVFGYQERYAEYRYFPSQITGRFRSNAAQPLDSWHLSQYFENLPTLGKDFIEENVPMDRIVSVPSEPDILFDSYIRVKAARPMPLYGVPGLVDHF